MEEVLDKVAPPPPPPPPPAPCCNKDISAAAVAKGKRTKRQRPHSPPSINPFTIINTPPAGEYNKATTTPTYSAASEESTTTEEEDTARCLILLARGHNFSIHVNHDPDLKQHSGSKFRHAETATGGGGGACTYACKTCDRVFPSFQALGGHRASHKKPKNDKRPPFFSDHEEDYNFRPSKKLKMPPSSISLQLSNIPTGSGAAVPRTHECAYCGAEFASGQALGGHMRRHRAEPEAKKSRNLLSLDLNLPAPEDENQRLGIAGRQQKSEEMLALSTTTRTLVDCPY